MPANGLIRGDFRHRGIGRLPSATRTRSGRQTASHGLVFVVYVGDEAGAIPSPPRRRARPAIPRHTKTEIHISFSTKVDQAARGRPLVITSDNRGGQLVIKSDNRTAGRYPLHRHDLDHRGIAKPSPRREKGRIKGPRLSDLWPRRIQKEPHGRHNAGG